MNDDGRFEDIAPTFYDYRAHQFGQLATGRTYRLKVTSDKGDTKWLTIGHDEMCKVRDILTGRGSAS